MAPRILLAQLQAPRSTRREFVVSCLAWCAAALPGLAHAETSSDVVREGRPEFHIRALTLPANLETAHAVDKELRRFLKREAKRNDWGGGRKNEIEARFELRSLTFQTSGTTLHVSATLVGQLPGGKRAESTVSFGGALSQKADLTRQVLSIVATGVMTRLADIERKRRGL